eukprot:g6587.t1
MKFALNELDYPVRYSLFGLGNVLLALWTHKVVARVNAGRTRFLVCTPLFVLCYLIYTLFDYERPSERTMCLHVVLNYLWLVPWKLCAFSMNRGSLKKAYESGSLSAFVVTLLLNINVAFEEKPVDAKKKDDDAITQPGQIVHAHDDVRFSVIKYRGGALLKELFSAFVRVFGKVVGILFCSYFYAITENHSFMNSVACAWFVYVWGSMIQDVSLFISLLVVNLKLEDSFDRPYLADSFSDFWSKRWNRVMQTQLRDLCYEPLVQGQWIAPRKYYGKREKSVIRRLIGIFLTFFASALIHWVILAGMCPLEHVPIRLMSLFIVSSFIVTIEVFLTIFARNSESFSKIANSISKVFRILMVHIGICRVLSFK